MCMNLNNSNWRQKYLSQNDLEKYNFSENRKLRIFSGRPKNDSDLTTDDWKDDLEIAFSVAEGPTHIKRP